MRPATRRAVVARTVPCRSAALRWIARSMARVLRRRGRWQPLPCKSASRPATAGNHLCSASGSSRCRLRPGTWRDTSAAYSGRWSTGSGMPGGWRTAPNEDCHNDVVTACIRAAASALANILTTRSPRQLLHRVTGRSRCRPRETPGPEVRTPATASAPATAAASDGAGGAGSADERTEALRPVGAAVPFHGEHGQPGQRDLPPPAEIGGGAPPPPPGGPPRRRRPAPRARGPPPPPAGGGGGGGGGPAPGGPGP